MSEYRMPITSVLYTDAPICFIISFKIDVSLLSDTMKQKGSIT